jgi:LEA14-like dessication related protein
MTFRKALGLGFLSTVAAAVLGGCAAMKDYVKEPEVDLQDVRVTDMSLADATLAFDLDITNPNPLGISMQGLSYKLELEDKTFFEGSRDEGLRIGAHDKSRLTIPIKLGYKDVLGTFDALRGNKDVKYRISGNAKFGPFSIPYEQMGTVPVPQLPDVSLQSLRVEKVTFSGAQLALGLRVKNANRFPIRFNGLDYSLKLGDASVLNGKSRQAFSVDPNGTGTLRLPISLDYGQMAGLVNTLRQGSSMPVTFNGNVKVPSGNGDIALPYNWKGNVPLFR